MAAAFLVLLFQLVLNRCYRQWLQHPAVLCEEPVSITCNTNGRSIGSQNRGTRHESSLFAVNANGRSISFQNRVIQYEFPLRCSSQWPQHSAFTAFSFHNKGIVYKFVFLFAVNATGRSVLGTTLSTGAQPLLTPMAAAPRSAL